jgi:hypothetical protein
MLGRHATQNSLYELCGQSAPQADSTACLMTTGVDEMDREACGPGVDLKSTRGRRLADMTEAMLDALDRLSDTGPEYREILANHGPMAAEALVRLGRDEAVSRWVEQYKRKLAPQPAAVDRIEPGEWQRYLAGRAF